MKLWRIDIWRKINYCYRTGIGKTVLSQCLFISRTHTVLWSRVHLSSLSVFISEMNKNGKLWLHLCSFYGKNSARLHWTMAGRWGQTDQLCCRNWTNALLFSFISKTINCEEDFFSKHAWQSTWQWRRMFVLTEAQILVYQDEWISFPLGAFAENLLFGLTKTEHGIFFRQDLERQWHEISFQWPLSKFRETTA